MFRCDYGKWDTSPLLLLYAYLWVCVVVCVCVLACVCAWVSLSVCALLHVVS